MKVDTTMWAGPSSAKRDAREAEAIGYDAIWSGETKHDPFLPLLLAAEHTDHLEVGSGVAIAFARNPMTVAVVANDLHQLTRGRFMLGLGSQIKTHIESRFGMPWSDPAPRMREFVEALRAIWTSWNEGERLAFRGDFYRHTLMTPFFAPEPNPYGMPKVFLAAVGERMTTAAGEVADGLLVHGFTTRRYLREVSLPALEKGLAASGRSRSAVEVSVSPMVVTGPTDHAIAEATAAARQQVAFYASTPAYRPVLELHGWGDLQTELRALTKRGAWQEMGALVSDEVLDAFAVVTDPDGVATALETRFGDVVDRLSLAPGDHRDRDWQTTLVAQLRSRSSRRPAE